MIQARTPEYCGKIVNIEIKIPYAHILSFFIYILYTYEKIH